MKSPLLLFFNWYKSTTNPLPCVPGTFSPLNQYSCSACDSGTYSNSGSGQCLSCSAGFQLASDKSSCSLCEEGFYCPTSSSKYQCPSGSFCQSGSQTFTQCDQNTFNNNTNAFLKSQCISCSTISSNLVTMGNGKSSSADCLCDINFYFSLQNSCQVKAKTFILSQMWFIFISL